MPKITFMGAGSTVFAKNVLGDCMCTDALTRCRIALYDIDASACRTGRCYEIINRHERDQGGQRSKHTWAWRTARKRCAARILSSTPFRWALYDPCTIIDFEVPKKYGLRQTIADTLGIGGILRALRTIPVMFDFARDMEEVCPDALFLNYTNPMAMLTGAMLRGTGVKTVGLCHSVQTCAKGLLEGLGMPYDEQVQWKIAGINHHGLAAGDQPRRQGSLSRNQGAAPPPAPKSTTTWCAMRS